MSYRDYQHHDAKGHFVNARVQEAVEYALALVEHKDYPLDYAEDIALANGMGRELNESEIATYFEVLANV